MTSHDGTPGQPMTLAPQVLARQLPGGAVLVHLESNQIFELNGTAARVCEMLASGTTRDAILDRLLEEFEVDPVRAAGDVDELLAALERRGLIIRG